MEAHLPSVRVYPTDWLGCGLDFSNVDVFAHVVVVVLSRSALHDQSRHDHARVAVCEFLAWLELKRLPREQLQVVFQPVQLVFFLVELISEEITQS